ncbi:MAG: M23 family metallopeptidase, partial [Gammaproteobacteria bacterium]|nr:M23 family metallopeptidase [Gammaproteobacteria bacterium]
MNLILISQDRRRHRNIHLPHHFFHLLLLLLLIGGPITTLSIGYRMGSAPAAVTETTPVVLKQVVHASAMSDVVERNLQQQQQEIELLRQLGEAELSRYAVQIAALENRMARIDAVGEQLVAMGKLDKGDYDFSTAPAVGGAAKSQHTPLNSDFGAPSFLQQLERLAEKIAWREKQMPVMEAKLHDVIANEKALPDGKPVKTGYISSRFGWRTDPFTGKQQLHDGIDFVAKHGTKIYATGAGVVTLAGQSNGYGLTIEINHGKGIVTRYGHNSALKV